MLLSMGCILCKSEDVRRNAIEGRAYFSCDHCELVWLDPPLRPSAQAEKKRYLEHENKITDPQYLAYLSRLATPVAALLKPGAKGFDYGCGPVEGMKHLLEPLGFLVDSYDPYFFSEKKQLNSDYDFLLCCEAAEHFYSPYEEFSTFDRKLKVGGVLGVSSRLLPAVKSQFSSWTYRRDPTHVCFYGERTVQWLAAHFGWELLRLESPLWILRKR